MKKRSALWQLSHRGITYLGVRKKADTLGALDKIAEKRRRPKVPSKTYVVTEKDGKMIFTRGQEQLVAWTPEACEKRLIKLLEEVNGDTRAAAVTDFWNKMTNMVYEAKDDMKQAHAQWCLMPIEKAWDKLLTPPPVAEPDIFSDFAL